MKTNAVSITLYDMTGSPVDPKIVKELEALAETLALQEKTLAINVAKE